MLIENGEITTGRYRLQKITDIPSDDMFLSCAMESVADYIVSRDPHLRNLKQYHGIRIIYVNGFVERVRKDKSQLFGGTILFLSRCSLLSDLS